MATRQANSNRKNNNIVFLFLLWLLVAPCLCIDKDGYKVDKKKKFNCNDQLKMPRSEPTCILFSSSKLLQTHEIISNRSKLFHSMKQLAELWSKRVKYEKTHNKQIVE